MIGSIDIPQLRLDYKFREVLHCYVSTDRYF